MRDVVAQLHANCAVMGAYYCGECVPCQAAAEIEALRSELMRQKAAYEAQKTDALNERDRWRDIACDLVENGRRGQHSDDPAWNDAVEEYDKLSLGK